MQSPDLFPHAGEPITIDEMLRLQCDIFIPAAVPDVIDEKAAKELNCRYVVEAANGPTTVEGDKVLPLLCALPRLKSFSHGGQSLFMMLSAAHKPLAPARLRARRLLPKPLT